MKQRVRREEFGMVETVLKRNLEVPISVSSPSCTSRDFSNVSSSGRNPTAFQVQGKPDKDQQDISRKRCFRHWAQDTFFPTSKTPIDSTHSNSHAAARLDSVAFCCELQLHVRLSFSMSIETLEALSELWCSNA